MQIQPLEAPDCGLNCGLIRSSAFKRSLHVAGLSGTELESLFRADRTRPDWATVAARGIIRIHCDEDGEAAADAAVPAYEVEHLDGGEARLSSGEPGQARLKADPCSDDRLLPGPLNLLLAQQWARQGLIPLHAAALRWRDQGLLVLGDRAAGKSSLILAALEQGAQVISDDWLLVGHCNGEARAERLREFLMFRTGATWDRFGPAINERMAFDQTSDGRFLHAISTEDHETLFPVWTGLDRCLLLHTPASTRPRTTRLAATDHSSVLAQLIEAAMPILMTTRFPLERERLFERFHALVSGLPTVSAVTGFDLTTRPGAVLDRLVGDELHR